MLIIQYLKCYRSLVKQLGKLNEVKNACVDFDGYSILPTLRGKKQKVRDFVYGAFTNAGIAKSDGHIFPIRVIRNKEYSLIYNANYKSSTKNTSIGTSLKMFEEPDYSPKKETIVSSWVELGRKDPAAREIAYKLNFRPEFELYHLSRDPNELKNVVDNPEYKEVLATLKTQLMNELTKLGDADPIATEKAIQAKKQAKHVGKAEKKKDKKKNKKKEI